MAKMVQKTFKLPEDWSRELTKKVGEKMVETGEEHSLASLIKEALDEQFGLSRATGVDAEGNSVSAPPTPNRLAQKA